MSLYLFSMKKLSGAFSPRWIVLGARQFSVPTGKERENLLRDNLEPAVQAAERHAKKVESELQDQAVRWVEATNVYYGKDRDMVSHPPMKQPVYHPKVRMGFIPDTWFQAFYNKTGVTGPYILLFSSTAFLLSKEYVVVDRETVSLLPFLLVVLFVSKKWGVRIQNALQNHIKKHDDEHYYDVIKQYKDNCNSIIETVDKNLERLKGVPEITKAKHEVIDLQLETEYRRRLVELSQSVQRRLNYHIEIDQTKQRFKQNYMVDWILQGVMKGITPQYEKEAMQQCFKDLRGLAAKA